MNYFSTNFPFGPGGNSLIKVNFMTNVSVYLAQLSPVHNWTMVNHLESWLEMTNHSQPGVTSSVKTKNRASICLFHFVYYWLFSIMFCYIYDYPHHNFKRCALGETLKWFGSHLLVHIFLNILYIGDNHTRKVQF